MSGRKRRGDAGITLIELAVVVAVFSLVAVIALQALSGALATRSRVAEVAGETAALARTTALMRRDLAAMVPVGPGFAADGMGLALVAAGQPTLPDGARRGLARIEWAVSPDGALVRRHGELGDDGQLVALAMLEGLTDWRVRALDDAGRWAAPVQSSPATVRALPRAVEVAFTHAELGDIRLVVAR